ncbi:hypothetical protein ES703_51865 [subsurface metagenome]
MNFANTPVPVLPEPLPAAGRHYSLLAMTGEWTYYEAIKFIFKQLNGGRNGHQYTHVTFGSHAMGFADI